MKEGFLQVVSAKRKERGGSMRFIPNRRSGDASQTEDMGGFGGGGRPCLLFMLRAEEKKDVLMAKGKKKKVKDSSKDAGRSLEKTRLCWRKGRFSTKVRKGTNRQRDEEEGKKGQRRDCCLNF